MTLQVPSSKSMTQRALIIAALAPRPTRIQNALICDDSSHLSNALQALGVGVQWQGSDVAITPAPLSSPAAPIYCGNAGTAVRFTSCLSLLSDGALSLDGNDYMRRRPIGPLTEALAQLGVHSAFHERPGCLPLTLTRTGPAATTARLDGSLSSQYLSGLLMSAPLLPNGLTLQVEGRAVSRPYVAMTLAMMRRAGARVQRDGQRYRVEPGGYPDVTSEFPVPIEADWSAAAFLLVAQRLIGDSRAIANLGKPELSLQGDAAIASWLPQFDAETGAETRFDLSDHPDLIAPLAAAALFANKPTLLDHVAHARVKECDRVAVLSRELGRLGARIETSHDHMRIHPIDHEAQQPVTLNPEHDHRMAMTFGVVSLRCPWIRVAQPSCVSKSFANFWQQLEHLRPVA